MRSDNNTTWNKQEGGVDEVAAKLAKERKLKDVIVVEIANVPETRYTDYFPQKVLKYIPVSDSLIANLNVSDFKADNYLKFIVDELKPFIDDNYPTLTTFDNTIIMGSSMGGLISLYALCEYPHIFGGAGCISTHSVLISPEFPKTVVDNWAAAFRAYLRDKLPLPNSHYIYMDYGDQTLDAHYEPYQKAIDRLMIDKGWSAPYWETHFFPGKAHTETDWQQRLHIPFNFLLHR